MDASFELIKAMMTRLKASLEVTAFVGQRIYDRVPEQQNNSGDLAFPYISLGPDTSVPDDFDCLDGEELTIQWDVWTSGDGEAYGTAQCRKICGAVKKALHDAELSLTTNALVSLQFELRRIIDDPNPAISHGVMQFTATVETP